jgi:hypothetical protein
MPAWRRRHLSRTCSGYAELWAGDVRVKLFAALRAYGDRYQGRSTQVRMVTITAPGSWGLPWDEHHCSHLGEHRHSGKLGCRVLPDAAGLFNELAPKWWRDLHREARQAAQRAGGTAPQMLARVWEHQKRGVLHAHVLLGYTTPGERAGADRYVGELHERAGRHGFGFVDRKRQLKEPTQAAAYLSSYFVAGSKGKLSLRESVLSQEMPRSIVYVAPWLSTRSGITMRSLRLRRYAWHVWRLLPEALQPWLDVELLWEGFCDGKTLHDLAAEHL